jgi:dTDP-L-rhamnose 4-epimerase
MRVLVIGGAGFIGSHIARVLLEKKHDVRVLDNLEPPSHPGDAATPTRLPDAVEFIRGDLTRRRDLEKSLHGMDALFHLAAVGGYTPDISRYFAVNSVGTALLMEVIRDSRPPLKKILVASSVAVYGEGKYRCPAHGVQFPQPRNPEDLELGDWEPRCAACGDRLEPLGLSESDPVSPQLPYSISKYDQERIVLTTAQALGIPALALRYFLTYGPLQSFTNPYTAVVMIFSSRLLNRLSPILYEDGEQRRDFIYVDDAARASVFLFEKEHTAHSVYNVGTGIPITVRRLAETLRETLGADVPLSVPGRFRPGDARHLRADIGRLQAEGFSCKTSFEEGIRRTEEWIRSLPHIPESFSDAESALRGYGLVRDTRRRPGL